MHNINSSGKKEVFGLTTFKMNREELQKLIDAEVSKFLSNNYMEETKSEQPKNVQIQNPIPPTNQIANLTEEELDDILFYGGKKPEDI